MSKVDFDQLIKDGKISEALRYFAKEGYNNGNFGHTRKLLIEHAAEQVEQVDSMAHIIKLKNKEMRVLEADNYNMDVELEKLYKQNKRYREALEFYAHEGVYDMKIELPNTDEYQQIIYYDAGKRARKALEESE